MTLSPSNSDAFSHTQTTLPRPAVSATNGAKLAPAETPKRPKNPFELYVAETRAMLQVSNRHSINVGSYDIDRELAIKWQELGPEGQEVYHRRFENGDYGSLEPQFSNAKRSLQTPVEDAVMGENGDDTEEL